MKQLNILIAITVAFVSSNANADLAAVGTPDPVTGFPAYYQDFGDLDSASPEPLALDLCLPNKAPLDKAELADGSCLMLPGDGSIPDETQPISFPDNFPDESFYYHVSANMALTGGSNALLVLAVEAAFANGVVQVGDQMVFSRLRYRFTAPSTGYYTIETPYSTDGPLLKNAGEFTTFTEDVGVNCAQGVFTCALEGATAPFLRPSDTRGGTPKPLHEAHGNKYLAPPGINTLVTGSPNGKNWFQILFAPDLLTTPTVIGFTDQFQLVGRLYDGAVPKPIPPSKPKQPVANPPIVNLPVVSTPPVATVASPSVSITAVDPLASEASGDLGKFMINLNAPSANNIKVKYSIEGNAIKGKDYRKISSSMIIPAGSVFGAIDVLPVDDKKNERTEKVTLKLSKKGIKGYSVKGPVVAQVKILDDD